MSDETGRKENLCGKSSSSKKIQHEGKFSVVASRVRKNKKSVEILNINWNWKVNSAKEKCVSTVQCFFTSRENARRKVSLGQLEHNFSRVFLHHQKRRKSFSHSMNLHSLSILFSFFLMFHLHKFSQTKIPDHLFFHLLLNCENDPERKRTVSCTHFTMIIKKYMAQVDGEGKAKKEISSEKRQIFHLVDGRRLRPINWIISSRRSWRLWKI